MTTSPPRRGSVDGLHGFPVVEARLVRVFVNNDMPRGVVSYDCYAGWADVLVWNDDGDPVTDGENFIVRRLFGNIEVFEA